MTNHVKIIGWLYIILGALGVLVGCAVFAILLGSGAISGDNTAFTVTGIVGLVVGGIFGTVAGYGTVLPSLLLTLFIYVVEILVAFIQAYVFTLLSAVFIGMAAAEHEHHDEHHIEGTEALALEASAPVVHGNGQPIDTNTVGTETALSPA